MSFFIVVLRVKKKHKQPHKLTTEDTLPYVMISLLNVNKYLSVYLEDTYFYNSLEMKSDGQPSRG